MKDHLSLVILALENTPVVESLWRSSEELTLLQFSQKVVTLMALSIADQCSDLAALDWDYMWGTFTGVQFIVVQLTKTWRTGSPRTVLYSALQDDPGVCAVSNLCGCIEMITPHVNNMVTPKPVFITCRKPVRRVRPATLGGWIKDSFWSAVVDTERFTATQFNKKCKYISGQDEECPSHWYIEVGQLVFQK